MKSRKWERCAKLSRPVARLADQARTKREDEGCRLSTGTVRNGVKTTHTLMTVGVIAALVVGEWPVAVALAPTTGRRPP